MPVSYFTEVDNGLARATSGDRIGSVPALAPEEPVGTNLLIFLDEPMPPGAIGIGCWIGWSKT